MFYTQVGLSSTFVHGKSCRGGIRLSCFRQVLHIPGGVQEPEGVHDNAARRQQRHSQRGGT